MTHAESAFHILYICNMWESSKSWMDHTGQGKPANMSKVNNTDPTRAEGRGGRGVGGVIDSGLFMLICDRKKDLSVT